jgi:hypothetical protein
MIGTRNEAGLFPPRRAAGSYRNWKKIDLGFSGLRIAVQFFRRIQEKPEVAE